MEGKVLQCCVIYNYLLYAQFFEIIFNILPKYLFYGIIRFNKYVKKNIICIIKRIEVVSVKNKEQTESFSEIELIELFYQTHSLEDKLQFFQTIQDDNVKLRLLNSIPEQERYKFIGNLKLSQSIAIALNSLSDDKVRNKTFNFVAKQLKGNSKKLLEIIAMVDFKATLQANMLTFTLNNLRGLDLDFLISIRDHIENYTQMKFKINEADDSRNIKYSFSEISAIIAKIEELTSNIHPTEIDEANRFFTIYSRLTGTTTYDDNCIRKQNDAKERWKNKKGYNWKEYCSHIQEIRKKAAGLYGGLVEGKAICAGYALILHEALQYVGLKTQYVWGINSERHERTCMESSTNRWKMVQCRCNMGC